MRWETERSTAMGWGRKRERGIQGEGEGEGKREEERGRERDWFCGEGFVKNFGFTASNICIKTIMDFSVVKHAVWLNFRLY